jgi:hypothetical protein
MTWAGERSEQPRSLQSPEMFFLLTLPFIERCLPDILLLVPSLEWEDGLRVSCR